MFWPIIVLLFLLVKHSESKCWSQTGFDCTGTCEGGLLCAGARPPACQCYAVSSALEPPLAPPILTPPVLIPPIGNLPIGKRKGGHCRRPRA